jgi:hypothetical protein
LGKTIDTEQERHSPKNPDQEGNKKQEVTMGFRELVKRSSFTDWCIAAFTCVLAVVGFLQWSILSGQLGESQKEFTSSHRPWVNVSGSVQIAGPLVFENTGAHVSVSYVLKNGGTAPALGTIQINKGLIVGPMPRTPEEIRQTIDCSKPTILPPSGLPGTIANASNIGLLILPGDADEIKDYTLATQRNQPVPSTGLQEVWFPLCIRYKDERGDFHGTGLLWRFISSDGKREVVPMGSIQGTFERIGVGNESY